MTLKLFRTFAICLTFFATIHTASAEEGDSTKNDRLISVHDDIMEEFEDVRHLKADAFSRLNGVGYILFDVREKDEYAVSHLQNAIRVDPDISAADFVEKYASQINGKKVILYCSVGYRSSRLAQRLIDHESAPNTDLYSLENGIFGWHNQSRPLYINGEETGFVHPYSFFRKFLLNRRDFTRYEVEE